MEKGTYSIEKSTVECYKIRHSSGMYWADVTIDSQGTKGRIQIASDYGSYQNYWGACGTNFKDFLSRLNIEYAADKFGADRWFDLDKTIASLRIRISENIDNKEEISKFAEELIQLNNSSCLEEFVSIMHDCHNIMDFECGTPDITYGITPQFKKFWKHVWPILLEQFKKETEIPVEAQM